MVWMFLSLWACSFRADHGPQPAVLRHATMTGGHEIAFLSEWEARVDFYPRSKRFVVDVGREHIVLNRRGAEVSRTKEDPKLAGPSVPLGDGEYREHADIEYEVRNSPAATERFAELGTLRMTRWEKTGSYGDIAYTPIPHAYMGEAWYSLKIGDDELRFREVAVRHLFGGGMETRLRWYTLPEEHADASDVSFLRFKPTASHDHLGSGGIYVIRPR